MDQQPQLDSKIEENWFTYTKELGSTKRGGIEKLIEYLASTDFKTAPASTKHHNAFPGGLVEHSLNVLRFARIIAKETRPEKIDADSVTISALLHDVCKANFYAEEEVWDKEYKNTHNVWRKIKTIVVKDQYPIGHGERSVIVCLQHSDLRLKDDEVAAVRWHMGFSDAGVHTAYPSGRAFQEACKKYPLVKILMMADQMAETSESI